MKKLTLYHASSTGNGQKQWSIWIEKDRTTVTVEWGKVGHTLQTSSDPTKPKGKPGTKSYMDEAACALFNYERQIRKKREEGYLEAGEAQGKRDFLMGLDKQFVPAKPVDMTSEPEAIIARVKKGNCLAQRKRNGNRHLVLITRKGKVRIYSRRMDDMTDHFPKMCQAIEILDFPAGTILDGEMVVIQKGRDNFRALGTITRSKPEKAAVREAEFIKRGELKFMMFDVLFHAGTAVWDKFYMRRYAILETLLANAVLRDSMGFPCPVFLSQNLQGTPRALMAQAETDGWEGIVFWFADEPTEVRNGGKPKRCGCMKWVRKQLVDVVATGYYLGSGDKSETVGGFNLAEFNDDGELVSCGNCGSGLTDAESRDALEWDYPTVIAIRHNGQEEDSRKFIFPIFVKRHEDKTVEEMRP
jgi:ATP-dependent DNA ligase